MTGRLGIALVFLLFGATFAAIGAGIAWHTHNSLAGARAAQGEVVDFAGYRRRPGKRAGQNAVVEFQAEDGRAVRFRARMSGTPQPYAMGERVTVLYDPARPDEARIDSFGELWALTAIFGGLGTIMLIVGALITRWGRRRARR